MRFSAPLKLALGLAAVALPIALILSPAANPYLYLGGLALLIVLIAAAVYYPAVFLAISIFVSQFKDLPPLNRVQPHVDVTVLALSFVLFVIVLHELFLRRPRQWVVRRRFASCAKEFLAFGLFAAMIVVSYFYTSAHEYGGTLLVRFLFIGGLLLLAPMFLLRSERDFRHFAAAFVILAIFLSVSLFFRARTVTAAEDVDVTRIGAGWLIGMAVMLVVFYRFSATAGSRNFVRVICLPLLAAGLIVAASRGAIFATAVAYLFTSVRLRGAQGRVGIIAVAALLAICAAASFYYVRNMGAGKYEGKVAELAKLVHGEDYRGSAAKRLRFYRAALEEIPQRPFFGLGLGGWATYYYHHDEREYPHDLFLEIAVEQGLVGLAIFFVFLCALFGALANLRRMSGDAFAVLFSVIVLSLTAALFSGNLDDNRVLWLWTGITLAVSNIVRAALARRFYQYSQAVSGSHAAHAPAASRAASRPPFSSPGTFRPSAPSAPAAMARDGAFIQEARQ